jgi:hypothetical protein
MTDKIIHLASSAVNPWAHTDNTLLDSVVFMSTCPNCKVMCPQQNYGFRSLVRFLVSNHPIEAHCADCSVFWSITANERAELAWMLLTE